ncbi:MAG: transglutaminase-like domain-containing protein [Vulcanimicrobiota bacterium]
MKQKILLLLLVIFSISSFNAVSAQSQGDRLFEKAEGFHKKEYYVSAQKYYLKALKQYEKENNREKALEARYRVEVASGVLYDYPYTEDEIRSRIRELFPDLSQERTAELISQMDYKVIEGEKKYESTFEPNIYYRNLDLMKSNKAKMEKATDFSLRALSFAFQEPKSALDIKPWKPYINPIKFISTSSLIIPRVELPEKGIARIWMPYPIQTASQRNLEVISIEPSKYCRRVPQTDDSIGVVYFEIPLEEIKDQLKIEIKNTFVSYEQYFQIDPQNIGEYDRESPDYKLYTRSERNIEITPEIEKTARKIVGDETNPYLQAEKIYSEIVKNVKYSYTPHLSLGLLEKSENIYVHKHQFGDCGAQSMYFCALCRSLGIPARSTGGYQAIPGLADSGGTHFWAEFYLPNYGWIPVDTTVAETMVYSDKLTARQKEKLVDYYFGNLDRYRLIIQKNVSIPVRPATCYPPLFSVVFQIAVMEWDMTDQYPDYFNYYKMQMEPYGY